MSATHHGTKYEIGGMVFANKTAIESYMRAVLRGYTFPAGCDIVRLGPEHEEFVRSLLKRHPHYEQYATPTISWIGVQRNFLSRFPEARRLVIARSDGSMRDISWQRCLEPANAFRDVSRVCRNLIQPQILAFRDAHFEGICTICEGPILMASDCHIDHMPPDTFLRLVRDWLQVMRLAPEDITIRADTRYEQCPYFEDEILTKEWVEYHQLHQRLRCVCARCNLTRRAA